MLYRCWVPLLFLYLALSIFPVAAVDIFINAGAQETYTDSLGHIWEPDYYYISGRSFRTNPAVSIGGTEDDELYLSGRYSHPADPPMVYDIPLQEGRYRVIMHFTDTYKPTSEPNKRVFNVLMEGMVAFQELDIVKEAGGPNKALQKSVTAVVNDGSLTIEFQSRKQNAALSAIEIHAVQESLLPIFLTAGGADFIDSFGNEWKADTGYYDNGRAFSRARRIKGTNKEQLYQSQRYSKKANAMTYEIPVPGAGRYDVYFHFCELNRKVKTPGKRVFNVNVDGSTIFRDVDVFAETGGAFRPLVKKTTVETTNSVLKIEFVRNIRNPILSGIEVHSVVHASPPGLPITPSMQPNATPTVFFEPIRINCGGGPNFTDAQGNEWESDSVSNYFNTGLTFSKPVPVENTDDDLLYQSERWDVFNGPSMTYEIPVPNGKSWTSYLYVPLFDCISPFSFNRM